MNNKKIAIAILARDCNEALKKNILEVEKLRAYFQSSYVIVVENDSKDGTKETLYKWKDSKDNVVLLIKDSNETTIPSKTKTCPFPPASMHRITRMANFRNIYLEYLKSSHINPDYLIVIDIDVKQFKSADIISVIKNAPKDWGGLFAYGQTNYYGVLPFMYDLFAYVPKEYIHEHHRKTHEVFVSGQTATKALKKEKYLECISAFGGIGVYKWDVIDKFSYEVIRNNRSNVYEAVCEHIPFNLKVINKGFKNYICKDLKVIYGKRSLKHVIINSIIPFPVFSYLYKKIRRVEFGENK